VPAVAMVLLAAPALGPPPPPVQSVQSVERGLYGRRRGGWGERWEVTAPEECLGYTAQGVRGSARANVAAASML